MYSSCIPLFSTYLPDFTYDLKLAGRSLTSILCLSMPDKIDEIEKVDIAIKISYDDYKNISSHLGGYEYGKG
jgi:hypothetical protein